MLVPGHAHDLFLSYAHAEAQWVEAFKKAFCQEFHEREGRPVSVWQDSDDLRAGGDSECFPSENPAHDVKISKGFWLGQTDVTQAAWKGVMKSEPSYFKGDELPVEQVSWTDAAKYCEVTGGRLPTEAEWEYAARGGSSSARYGELDAIAWYSTNSDRKTHPVGAKQPNQYGLYDMLGNVWQWVQDDYGPYWSVAATDPLAVIPSTAAIGYVSQSVVSRQSLPAKHETVTSDIRLATNCCSHLTLKCRQSWAAPDFVQKRNATED